MKHKQKRVGLLAGLVIAALLMSCNSGHKVVSSFGKRKYTKGFYFNSSSTPKVAGTPTNAVPQQSLDKVAKNPSVANMAVSGQFGETAIKETNNNSPEKMAEKKVPAKTIPSGGILPRLLAVKDIFRNNSPLSRMPADTGQGDEKPTDYRKYNREAIGGFILGIACLALLFTGFGLLLSIPGFLLSLWGLDSQKYHTFALIGTIFNLIGLVALIVFLLVELIVIVNGG